MSLLSAVLQEANKATTEDYRKHRDAILIQIKELTDKIQLLSWALQQNFIDNYLNFTPTKSLEQLNYKSRKGNVISDFTKTEDAIQTLLKRFSEDDEDFNSLCNKLNKSYEKFKDLIIVVEGKKVLELANHEFGRFNYMEAMLAVKDLQNHLESMRFDEDAAKALANIRAQAENQLALYSAHLSIEWEDIFTWTEKKSLHYLTYSLTVQQCDPILIQKVLKTLYATERMNAELGLFSHFFIDELLHNVIRYNCNIFTEENVGALVFNIKIDLNDTKKPNYQTIFNNLTAVFEFLQSTLGSQFENDRTFIEAFAETIREKFFNKIIEDCIRTNLPSCDSSYQNYKNIVIELDLFNKFLIDLKFVSTDESPLNQYIHDTECVLYNKKCDKLLSEIRNLLTRSLSYNTEVVGTFAEIDNESVLDVSNKDFVWELNKPLFLPKCVISQNVKIILMMIVEHLEESTKLPEKYSKQLVSYIKDIAVMYQCLVPRKFQVNLECCPLDIALFFNNCFYLAHGLLGPPWRNTLPFKLADSLTAVLVECIQDLRVLGLEKISLYLQNQKNDVIKSIQGTESPWTHDTFDQFHSAVNNAVTLMKDLKSSWINILPTKMYEMSISTLVQVLCEAMLERIFVDSKPIEEELIYLIAVLLEDTVSEIGVLFEEPINFENKIGSWNKFARMPQLLKAQLLEIAELWNKSKDLSNCYSCEEIRQIVKMRFPDDKYRLKILKEIQ